MRFSRRQLVHTRDLLVELLAREMKLRYERSSLGMLWAVLNPPLVTVERYQHAHENGDDGGDR